MFLLRPIPLHDDGRVSHEVFGWFSSWLKRRGGNPPPRELMPTVGAVANYADYDSDPAAIAFMYLDATGSGVAHLAWLATDPDIQPHQAARVILAVTDYLCEHARSLNYWSLIATHACPSLSRQLTLAGFSPLEKDLTSLILTL